MAAKSATGPTMAATLARLKSVESMKLKATSLIRKSHTKIRMSSGLDAAMKLDVMMAVIMIAISVKIATALISHEAFSTPFRRPSISSVSRMRVSFSSTSAFSSRDTGYSVAMAIARPSRKPTAV